MFLTPLLAENRIVFWTAKPFARFILLLALMGCSVPVPTEENTIVVEGTLSALTTCCEGGDVLLHLDGYASSFYLNRAIEAGFYLDTFASEVAIGDTVYLRAFEEFLPVYPSEPARSGNIPLAEISTADKIYFSTMPTAP